MAELTKFEKLVFEMRTAQKQYFKERQMFHLMESKKLEKKVDKHLDDKINPSLF